MNRFLRLRKPITLVIGLITLGLTACNPVYGITPQEVQAFNSLHQTGVTVDQANSTCTQLDSERGTGACLKVITDLNTAKLAELPEPAVATKTDSVKPSLSDAQLARLAKCESGGNPRARSSSGAFTGLYQFNQSTWNGVAKRHLPEYVGVLPGNAPPSVQDAMARALFSERGRQPWPVCGRRI